MDKGAELDAKNKVGETALMLAQTNRNTEIVKLLLGHGAKNEVSKSQDSTASPQNGASLR
jgi:ankyrin repeat protein